MAKLTWKGEDGLHGSAETGGLGGPSFTTAFGGIRFPKGEAVEVVDRDILARAKRNRFFEVTGVPGRPKGGDGDKD